MSQINSPLGSVRTVNSPAATRPAVKHYAVADESFGGTPQDMFDIPEGAPVQLPQISSQPTILTPEQFNELQARKQAWRQASQKPTSESRQRIEILTGIGRLETTVTINEHHFTLQSLKAREMREVVKAAALINVFSEQFFELRVQTLARSIIKIDDLAIGLMLGDDSVESKLNFLEESEEHIINQLYTSYSSMIKQHENKFAVKSETEAQEVAAEIKK